MENTITWLKSMTDDTIKALSSADYENATFHLDILYRETKKSIYEAQVLYYRKLGRFDLALHYAMQIIQLIPDSYSGYLYTGDCLLEQSKLYQAMSFYDQGLNQRKNQSFKENRCNDQNRKNNTSITITADDDDDKWFLLLNNRRKHVSTLLNYRIPDWIHKLPFDVVCDGILPYLSMQERRTCLNVSRSWRSLISGCVSLWRTLEFHGRKKARVIDDSKEYHGDGDGDVVANGNDNNDDSDYEEDDSNDLLDCIGEHVTRVTLSQMSDQQLQVVFGRIVQSKCTRLKSFCFSECNISAHQITVYLNRVCSNNFVQYLEIYQNQQNFSLEQLLDGCPSSLTHLYFKQNPPVAVQGEATKKVILPIRTAVAATRTNLSSSSSSSRDNNNTSNNYNTQQQQQLENNSSNNNSHTIQTKSNDPTLHKPINLTHLYLDCKTPIDRLLHHCSNLEYLVLENRSQLELYTYIQSCPNLRHFQHNTATINTDMTVKKVSSNNIWDTVIDQNKKDNNNDKSSKQFLSLRTSYALQPQQQEGLSFTALPHGIDNNNNTQLGQRSGQLQHLILGKSKISNQERINIKRTIEENRGSLETFTLHGEQGDRRNWAWVFGGELDPYRLVRLDLSVEMENTLIPLLRHSASTLQYLALRSMPCVDDDVLDVLRIELPGLRQLILLDCINMTERGMARLVGTSSTFHGNNNTNNQMNNNAKGYSTSSTATCLLEHLEIAGYSFCLTEHVLELIGMIPNLKSFKLSWCGFGSSSRMHRLVETMVNCHSRVEYLSFTRSSIHADTLDMLGNLSDLQCLKICMCTNVTDLGVRRLIDKKLEKKSFHLSISECNLLSSKLIDYAYNIMGNQFCYIKG